MDHGLARHTAYIPFVALAGGALPPELPACLSNSRSVLKDRQRSDPSVTEGLPLSRPVSTAQTSPVSRRSRDILTLPQCGLFWTEYAPSVFIPTVTDRMLIRTSHPSGSRHWGCSDRRSHPAPEHTEPQKIVSALACPSAAVAEPRPRRLHARTSHHRCLWRYIQPLAGSCQRRISQTLQPRKSSWTPPRVCAGRFLARHSEAQ